MTKASMLFAAALLIAPLILTGCSSESKPSVAAVAVPDAPAPPRSPLTAEEKKREDKKWEDYRREFLTGHGQTAAAAAIDAAEASDMNSPANRKALARELQETAWRNGCECKIEARGTTFYFEYVLIGRAFTFQFGEDVLNPNRDKFRKLGFKKVTLTDGYENSWTWDLRTDADLAAERRDRAAAERRAAAQQVEECSSQVYIGRPDNEIPNYCAELRRAKKYPVDMTP